MLCGRDQRVRVAVFKEWRCKRTDIWPILMIKPGKPLNTGEMDGKPA